VVFFTALESDAGRQAALASGAVDYLLAVANDNVARSLALAHLRQVQDHREQAREALESSLDSARQNISGLLAEAGSEGRLEPGDLRRSARAKLGRR